MTHESVGNEGILFDVQTHAVNDSIARGQTYTDDEQHRFCITAWRTTRTDLT